MCHPSTPGCLPIERRTYAHAKPAQTEAPSPNVHPRGADKQVRPIHSGGVCSARGVTAAKGTRGVHLKRETPTGRDYPRCGCIHLRWQNAAWQLHREAGGGELPQKEARGSLAGWGKPSAAVWGSHGWTCSSKLIKLNVSGCVMPSKNACQELMPKKSNYCSTRRPSTGKKMCLHPEQNTRKTDDRKPDAHARAVTAAPFTVAAGGSSPCPSRADG